MGYPTREAWLNSAYLMIASIFKGADAPLPPVESIRISTGFGLARGENASILGQTIDPRGSADGVTTTIFISPALATGEDAMSVLLHECVHVAVGTEHQHDRVFAELGKRIGLEGRPTVMTPGAVLAAEIVLMFEELGEYPHVALDVQKILAPRTKGAEAIPGSKGAGGRITTGPARQRTRHIGCRCENQKCPAIGYRVQTTSRWLEIAQPFCPVCLTEMIVQS